MDGAPDPAAATTALVGARPRANRLPEVLFDATANAACAIDGLSPLRPGFPSSGCWRRGHSRCGHRRRSRSNSVLRAAPRWCRTELSAAARRCCSELRGRRGVVQGSSGWTCRTAADRPGPARRDGCEVRPTTRSDSLATCPKARSPKCPPSGQSRSNRSVVRPIMSASSTAPALLRLERLAIRKPRHHSDFELLVTASARQRRNWRCTS